MPDGRCESVGIDFVGPLPDDEGFNCLVTMTCYLGSDVCVSPCHSDISAEDFAVLFLCDWYCENGLPSSIIFDRDKIFISHFWKAFTRLTGVKLGMSISFHLQTDGTSERSNKTFIQALHFHVQRNQKGWVQALPLVCFNYMNTVNMSTGFTPFQLCTGRSPRIIPPLVDILAERAAVDVAKLIHSINADIMEAQDNLLLAKSQQAFWADKSRGDEISYKVDNQVLLLTFNCQRDYMQRGDYRVAKFMVHFDGLYTVVQA